MVSATTINLQGEWRFDIDRNDVGEKEQWYAKKLSDKIYLPGSMAENRKGDEVTLQTQWTASIYDSSFFYNPRLEKYRVQENLKLPFWLTPVKYYVGAAWYQRDVVLSSEMLKGRVFLFLERPHTETRLWVNAREVGMQNSLSVPHIFEITSFLKKGNNQLTICVDNRTKDIDVGKDSHSITDQTQGNWNGIVGKIELKFTPKTYIEDLQVYPDLSGKKALVKIKLEGDQAAGMLELKAHSFNSNLVHQTETIQRKFTTAEAKDMIEIELPMGENFLTWDEFQPNLYKLTATLSTKRSRCQGNSIWDA